MSILASTYGTGTYNTSTYNNGSVTGSTGAASGSSNGGATSLTNTGFDVILIVTLAAVLLFAAVTIRVWKRSAKRRRLWISRVRLGRLHLELRFVNTGLLIVICLINGYIVASPLVPNISFWWRSHHTNEQARLTQAIDRPTTSPRRPAGQKNQPNSLIIPTMLLNQPVIDGPKEDAYALLRQGIWRWPDSSTPDKGGNTVLLAHRFSYTGPRGAFYFLDKLQSGDEIGLVWHNRTYTYRVESSREVPPSETAILNDTSESQLTLFTCTPLFHPVDRLVVTAELEKVI